MLFATYTGVVTWSGGTAVLTAGKTTAHPDHPIVKERPDLWAEGEATPDFDVAPGRVSPSRVERATRAPGEVRPAPAKKTARRSSSKVDDRE